MRAREGSVIDVKEPTDILAMALSATSMGFIADGKVSQHGKTLYIPPGLLSISSAWASFSKQSDEGKSKYLRFLPTLMSDSFCLCSDLGRYQRDSLKLLPHKGRLDIRHGLCASDSDSGLMVDSVQ